MTNNYQKDKMDAFRWLLAAFMTFTTGLQIQNHNMIVEIRETLATHTQQIHRNEEDIKELRQTTRFEVILPDRLKMIRK